MSNDLVPTGSLAVRRARAMQMYAMRVAGKTHAEIAAEMNCHEDTVARNLDWAAREGLLIEREEDIVQKLVPEAIRVYTAALAANDTFVAKDVLMHAAKMSERFAQRKEHEEELSLAAWIRTRKERADDAARTQGERPEGHRGAVIDVVATPAGAPEAGAGTDLGGIPATQTGTARGGDEGPDNS